MSQQPCKDCPFRSEVSFCLGKERAQQIANEVILGDGALYCHKTLTYSSIDDDGGYIHTGNEKPCVGAILAIAKERGDATANPWVRMGVRIKRIDINSLDKSVKVHSAKQFVRAHS